MDFELSKRKDTDINQYINQKNQTDDKDNSGLPLIIINYFDQIRISFFQFIGTALFAYGICVSQYAPPPTYPLPSNYVQVQDPIHSLFVSLGLLMGILFCGQLSGGHCNPAVTTIFMLQKNSNITFAKGLLYMISQILGAFAGSVIAWALVDNLTAPIIEKGTQMKIVWIEFGGEIFGTVIFTFMILILTTKQTTFVGSTFSVYWMIIISLYIGRTFSFRTEGLNPALAIGMQVAYALFNNKWNVMSDCWALVVGPYIGAIIASLLYQQFYKPVTNFWKVKQQ